MKILVAEDNPGLQVAAGLLLEEWGYEADLASDGQEAVTLALANPYDLALMDLNMPKLNGCEATRMIRRQTHYFPILALTSNPRSEQSDCLAAGMDDFMEKPYDCQKLHAKIKELTLKSTVIDQQDNRFRILKEMPMNSEHLRELRELDKKGLTKLIIKGRGDELVVHKNVQNKISYDFVVENKAISEFLERSEEKPGICHLYRENFCATVKCVLPEDLKRLLSEEDEIMKGFPVPAVKKEEGERSYTVQEKPDAKSKYTKK